ncbi:hypothetical protein CHUAL_009546 [Chamberlinius hualienensis]
MDQLDDQQRLINLILYMEENQEGGVDIVKTGEGNMRDIEISRWGNRVIRLGKEESGRICLVVFLSMRTRNKVWVERRELKQVGIVFRPNYCFNTRRERGQIVACAKAKNMGGKLVELGNVVRSIVNKDFVWEVEVDRRDHEVKGQTVVTQGNVFSP